jgi:hypothetical protein
MLAHIALSIALAFVSQGDDATMARQLDAASLGNADAISIGIAISCYRGVAVRVPMQPLVTISGSSLAHDLQRPAAPDCDGALELALVELEHVDTPRRAIVTDLPVPPALQKRAAAAHVELVALPASSTSRVPTPTTSRPRSEPVLALPAPDHSPVAPLAAFALLGVAAAFARRAC